VHLEHALLEASGHLLVVRRTRQLELALERPLYRLFTLPRNGERVVRDLDRQLLFFIAWTSSSRTYSVGVS
jgi:hypothetical protein